MTLTTFTFLQGILSTVFIFIATLAFISIFFKYLKTKTRDFFLLSITVIILSEPWWPSAFSFIVALCNNGEGIPVHLYIFLGNAFIPIGLICWAIIFTDLILVEKQKIVIGVVLIFSFIFEFNLLYWLVVDSDMLGILVQPTDIEYKFLNSAFLIIIIFYILITGLTFGIETLRTNDPVFQLKGKMMIIAFISFSIFAILDSTITINEFILFFVRILGMVSFISLFGGFLLPNWMRKLLLREK